ncbi:MAG: AMP-binding protein [Odoribacter sp.]|nr:AMP-binding protein [Odoribacter sp.]
MDTIIDLFERSCVKFPDNPYLWEKRQGKYEAMTYSQTNSRVRDIAAGLMAIGIKKGERVALLSEGRRDWVCAELGILYAGGINVPLSIRLTEQELVFRLNHSEARFVFVSSYYLKRLRNIEGQLNSVERIFVFDYKGEITDKYVSFTDLVEKGKRHLHIFPGCLETVGKTIRGEDIANISYTSGTTAEPKGILLTHANYVSNVLQADSLIRIPAYYKILLFLPWDHSFAHTVGIYSFMYNVASLAAVDFGNSPLEFLRNIPVNMKEIKPHVLLSVPAIAKNFRKNIEAKIRRQGRFIEILYTWGLKFAYWFQGRESFARRGVKSLAYPIWYLFDRLLFFKIRQSFGGELRFFIGGGALLDIELQQYYCALGIPMYQGYGLSEASPVISSNIPERYRLGSSGMPVRPMELKICDEGGKALAAGETGEIVIKGGNVMRGYWKNESSTKEVIREGWLYTGDLGYVDSDGFLMVLGRFKSLLIANDGEKYSPEGIEEAIVEKSKFIDYCILYNDQSLYTVGLIAPNKVVLKEYIQQKHVELGSIEGYKLMLEKLHEELMEFRYGGKFAGLFPERWLPAVVAILPEPLSDKNGTINSTSKVVRRRITELYQTELEQAYTVEGKDIFNVKNTQNIRRYMES